MFKIKKIQLIAINLDYSRLFFERVEKYLMSYFSESFFIEKKIVLNEYIKENYDFAKENGLVTEIEIVNFIILDLFTNVIPNNN